MPCDLFQEPFQRLQLPPWRTWAALPWCHASTSSQGLPAALEALYGAMCNSRPGGTSILPTVMGFGLGTKWYTAQDKFIDRTKGPQCGTSIWAKSFCQRQKVLQGHTVAFTWQSKEVRRVHKIAEVGYVVSRGVINIILPQTLFFKRKIHMYVFSVSLPHLPNTG